MSERLSDIVRVRRSKLEGIRKSGIDPYPSKTGRTHTNAEALERFEELARGVVTLVGRIRSWRHMGKIVFAHIEDGTGRIQVLMRRDAVGEDAFAFANDYLDLGDYIECTGTLVVTKTGEKTLDATSFRLLAKSLLPLPGEHYGIEDTETRLRQRYLDILMNPEIKELFVRRARFWSSMREFLVAEGFLELEMPVLEGTPGGAEAEPFVTHHNALDRDFYLRISLELPLKKMLVAGFEKVFEIGRIFRNEGISTEHLQDYTQMEFYWAYADFDMLLELSRRLYQHVILRTFGTLQLPWRGVTVDWSGEWPRRDYMDLFRDETGLDLPTTTLEDLKAFAQERDIGFDPADGRGRLIDLIFKKTIRTKSELFEQPCFLVRQPVEIEPLAKRDPSDPGVVQRMQILACGTELGKGFGELNDPIDQRARFEEQMRLREAGDAEAQMLDEEYLEAMEYGMPPAAGFGLSERLFAVLNDKSVRETQIFPLMKRR